MKYFVYLLQNIINLKVYIGKTNNPVKRLNHHFYISNSSTQTNKYFIHKAINKYGKHKFDFIILEVFDSESNALIGEIKWINCFQSNNPKYGYNLTAGGDGLSGYKHLQSSKDKISKANTGRKFSDETKQRMRESHLGKTSGMLGKNHSNNKKQQQSQMVSGENNYFYDKHFSGELNHNSSLTDAEAIEIIELLKTKEYKNKEIANMYNVSIQVISKIKTGRTRSHLPR